RRTVAVATIFLDRMLGLLALFFVGAFVSFYQSPTTEHPAFTTVAWIVRVGSVVGLIGLLVMLHPATPKSRWLNRLVHVKKIGPVCGDFIHAIGLYQSKARILWLAVGISIVGHFGMLSSFYFCALALNAPEAIPDYAAHMLFMPAAEVISMLPIVPGGVGVLEGSIGEFYRFAGYDRGNGFLTGIGYRAITILIAVIGGVYYLTSRRAMKKLILESKSAPKTEK
ncbi:MAG: flippase-like domain-containing protein, partial [Planctomycetes bacterium]|nr:flippase-like domain-containing protein [Planctomycetota bacterium]